MSGCKIPESKNEENCYRIWITGECDFLIVSPDMIVVLIAKMRRSDTREMTVPSEEVLPPEYAEYLTRVMEANEDGKNIYDMAVEQFRYLEVEQSSCFEKVNVTGEKRLSLIWRREKNSICLSGMQRVGSGMCFVMKMGRKSAYCWNI